MLSYVRFKEFFSWRRNLWHKFQVRSVSRFNLSDKIIAVSDSTKKDLIEKYELSFDKIKTIYSGISDLMSRPPKGDLELFRKEITLEITASGGNPQTNAEFNRRLALLMSEFNIKALNAIIK